MHLKVWGWCSRETTACLRYNCHSGYSNWFFGWSAHKKSWCCNHKHLGCPGTWHGSYHLHTNVMHGVGHAHGRIYDCHAGFSNWKQGWSDSKKDWCCSHEKKGCLKYHCHSNALWPRYVTYVGVFLAYFFGNSNASWRYVLHPSTWILTVWYIVSFWLQESAASNSYFFFGMLQFRFIFSYASWKIRSNCCPTGTWFLFSPDKE